jgi:hypothetical protein
VTFVTSAEYGRGLSRSTNITSDRFPRVLPYRLVHIAKGRVTVILRANCYTMWKKVNTNQN